MRGLFVGARPAGAKWEGSRASKWRNIFSPGAKSSRERGAGVERAADGRDEEEIPLGYPSIRLGRGWQVAGRRQKLIDA